MDSSNGTPLEPSQPSPKLPAQSDVGADRHAYALVSEKKEQVAEDVTLAPQDRRKQSVVAVRRRSRSGRQ